MAEHRPNALPNKPEQCPDAGQAQRNEAGTVEKMWPDNRPDKLERKSVNKNKPIQQKYNKSSTPV